MTIIILCHNLWVYEREKNIVSCRRPCHERQKVCFAWDNLEAAWRDHPRTATVAADVEKFVCQRSSVLISVKRRTLLTTGAFIAISPSVLLLSSCHPTIPIGNSTTSNSHDNKFTVQSSISCSQNSPTWRGDEMCPRLRTTRWIRPPYEFPAQDKRDYDDFRRRWPPTYGQRRCNPPARFRDQYIDTRDQRRRYDSDYRDFSHRYVDQYV